MPSKVMTLSRAISTHVCHDDAVVLGACLEACIPFAAAHELIRLEFRGLNLIAPISDMATDMLIGAGCVGQVTGAWVGNVSGGLGHNYRRSVEQGVPHQVKVHDHSNFSLGMALTAGAYGIPFIPVRSLLGSDLLRSNSTFQVQEDEQSATSYVRVPSLNPDVALLSVQRSDEEGNCHFWGNLGVLQEAALASKKIILITEELVDREVIESDPNRVPFPGFLVKAVCHVPAAVHPSPMTGFYKRDNDFFNQYHQQSRNREGFLEWLDDWVLNPANHEHYLDKLGVSRKDLQIKGIRLSEPVNFAAD